MAGNLDESRLIIEDIKRSIRDAVFVIADLSERNPNVFYEVGYGHGLGKKPRLITHNLSDIPPLLEDLEFIVYENKLSGLKPLVERLTLSARTAIQREHDTCSEGVFPPDIPPEKEKFVLTLIPNEQIGNTHEQILVPVIRALDSEIICQRSHSVYAPGSIRDHLWNNIHQAKLIIADLTGSDPSVFYELGLCHALEKQVILLTRHENHIPFDLRGLGYIKFSDDDIDLGVKSRESIAEKIAPLLI